VGQVCHPSPPVRQAPLSQPPVLSALTVSPGKDQDHYGNGTLVPGVLHVHGFQPCLLRERVAVERDGPLTYFKVD